MICNCAKFIYSLTLSINPEFIEHRPSVKEAMFVFVTSSGTTNLNTHTKKKKIIHHSCKADAEWEITRALRDLKEAIIFNWDLSGKANP